MNQPRALTTTFDHRYWKLRKDGDDNRDLLLRMANEVRNLLYQFVLCIMEQLSAGAAVTDPLCTDHPRTDHSR